LLDLENAYPFAGIDLAHIDVDAKVDAFWRRDGNSFNEHASIQEGPERISESAGKLKSSG
jgi:hypothetical protein